MGRNKKKRAKGQHDENDDVANVGNANDVHVAITNSAAGTPTENGDFIGANNPDCNASMCSHTFSPVIAADESQRKSHASSDSGSQSSAPTPSPSSGATGVSPPSGSQIPSSPSGSNDRSPTSGCKAIADSSSSSTPTLHSSTPQAILAQIVYQQLGPGNSVTISQINSGTGWKRLLKFPMRDCQLKSLKAKFFTQFPDIFWVKGDKEICALFAEDKKSPDEEVPEWDLVEESMQTNSEPTNDSGDQVLRSILRVKLNADAVDGVNPDVRKTVDPTEPPPLLPKKASDATISPTLSHSSCEENDESKEGENDHTMNEELKKDEGNGAALTDRQIRHMEAQKPKKRLKFSLKPDIRTVPGREKRKGRTLAVLHAEMKSTESNTFGEDQSGDAEKTDHTTGDSNTPPIKGTLSPRLEEVRQKRDDLVGNEVQRSSILSEDVGDDWEEIVEMNTKLNEIRGNLVSRNLLQTCGKKASNYLLKLKNNAKKATVDDDVFGLNIDGSLKSKMLPVSATSVQSETAVRSESGSDIGDIESRLNVSSAASSVGYQSTGCSPVNSNVTSGASTIPVSFSRFQSSADGNQNQAEICGTNSPSSGSNSSTAVSSNVSMQVANSSSSPSTIPTKGPLLNEERVRLLNEALGDEASFFNEHLALDFYDDIIDDDEVCRADYLQKVVKEDAAEIERNFRNHLNKLLSSSTIEEHESEEHPPSGESASGMYPATSESVAHGAPRGETRVPQPTGGSSDLGVKRIEDPGDKLIRVLSTEDVLLEENSNGALVVAQTDETEGSTRYYRLLREAVDISNLGGL